MADTPTGSTLNFYYQGVYQTASIPSNISSDGLYVILRGGDGGVGAGGSSAPGGAAGEVSGYLPSWLVAGKTLYIYVGQAGQGISGGFNGGGDGYNGAGGGNNAGGGGGASDIRIGGTTANDTNGDYRYVVAAGGGGTGGGNYYSGGAGGGTTGGSGNAAHTTQQGGGGTQSAGGAAGVSGGGASGIAVAGSKAFGGRGAGASNTPYSPGGGGGGGYYGGGGGGAHQLGSAGGGGGGSSFVNYLASGPLGGVVDTPGAAYGGSVADGFITLKYIVGQTWNSAVYIYVTGGLFSQSSGSDSGGGALLGKGKLVVAGAVPNIASVAPSAIAQLNVLGSLPQNGIVDLSALGALLPTAGTSEFFKGVPIEADSELTIDGFAEQLPDLEMGASASVYIQQTLSGNHIYTFAEMDLTDTSSEIFADEVDLTALSSMHLNALVLHHDALTIEISGSMDFDGMGHLFDALRMAAKGSVSLVDEVSVPGGVSMYPQALMGLTGQHFISAELPILSSTALLEYNDLVKHPDAVSIASAATLAIAPTQYEFVGPDLAAYGSLIVPNVELTQVVNIHTFAQMIIDLPSSGGGVLFPPYLAVVDDNNEVQFFVTSYPNQGDVRQAVTRATTGS